MAPKPKLKTPAVDAPQSTHDCACRISAYGELQARRAALVAEMSERQRQIGEEYQERITKIDERLKLEHMAIQMFCEPNRGSLADENGVKYIEFTTGKVEWRKQPDTIAVPRTPENLDTVLGLLEQRGLVRFIRVKREINKEAMLLERVNLTGLIAGIPGLSLRIGQEAFTIKPLETDPS
jgi:phage host-nuclease inhibitor protein Gam